MRHKKAKSKLGMRSSHRKAVLRNMVTSLMEHESLVTTDARAKALRSLADKMITLGKRGDLHARRQVAQVIRTKDVTRRVFEEIAPRYADRNGGYVRVMKKGFRKGDGAAVSVVELVEKSAVAPTSKAAKGSKGLKDRLLSKLKSED